MKRTQEKLGELQNQLKQVIKEVEAGKLGKAEAADKILNLREEIDAIIQHLRISP